MHHRQTVFDKPKPYKIVLPLWFFLKIYTCMPNHSLCIHQRSRQISGKHMDLFCCAG